MDELKITRVPDGYEGAELVTLDRTEATPDCTWPLTELGNAERFAWRYGHRFAHTLATGWLRYNPTKGRWERDASGAAVRAMTKTIRLIPLEIAALHQGEKSDEEFQQMQAAYDTWARKCEAASHIHASLKLATTHKAIARDWSHFDRHPELFCCGNGVVHLDSLQFLPHDPAYLLTVGSDICYDPQALCPQYRQFLNQVMDGNQNKIAYLGRGTGYTMSANTSEQCMFLPYGGGGTGKGTFLHILEGILGGYAMTADAETFMAKRGDSGQPFDLAGMQGVRALISQETDENKRLAVAKVKRMTGQDKIRACFKHHDHYEFQPVWKIWLATNDRPAVSAQDDAAWDRLKPIPFDIKFRDTERQIKDLDKKLLEEEGSGILNWALEGYREWKAIGISHPEEVIEATQDWRDSEDFLQRFLDERTTKTGTPTEYVSKTKLFEAFSSWAESNKEARGLNNRQFGELMRKKGFSATETDVSGKQVKVWKWVRYGYGESVGLDDEGNRIIDSFKVN